MQARLRCGVTGVPDARPPTHCSWALSSATQSAGHGRRSRLEWAAASCLVDPELAFSWQSMLGADGRCAILTMACAPIPTSWQRHGQGRYGATGLDTQPANLGALEGVGVFQWPTHHQWSWFLVTNSTLVTGSPTTPKRAEPKRKHRQLPCLGPFNVCSVLRRSTDESLTGIFIEALVASHSQRELCAPLLPRSTSIQRWKGPAEGNGFDALCREHGTRACLFAFRRHYTLAPGTDFLHVQV